MEECPALALRDSLVALSGLRDGENALASYAEPTRARF
jgi:hypothetical protein